MSDCIRRLRADHALFGERLLPARSSRGTRKDKLIWESSVAIGAMEVKVANDHWLGRYLFVSDVEPSLPERFQPASLDGLEAK
jgi:hypothetical protein